MRSKSLNVFKFGSIALILVSMGATVAAAYPMAPLPKLPQTKSPSPSIAAAYPMAPLPKLPQTKSPSPSIA
jgi:hypothetical protein